MQRPDREGSTGGRVYFVNTVGNLLGGVVCGFVLESFGRALTLLAFAATSPSLQRAPAQSFLSPNVRQNGPMSTPKPQASARET